MTPLVLLIGSLAFSLAFNVAWAWGTHPLSVLAAAACTLIVPAGLHLWPQIPAHNGWVRLLRALVMSGICSAAAVTSFSHAVDMLSKAGWSPATAWSVTGGAELLVALSTMAVRAPGRPVEAVEARTSPDSEGVTPDPAPSPGTSRAQVTVPGAGNRAAEDTGPCPLDTPGASEQVNERAAGDVLGNRAALPNGSTADDRSAVGGSAAVDQPDDRSSEPVVDPVELAKLAASGVGRRKAAKTLGVSPYRAERLLAQARTTPPQPPGQPRPTADEGDRLVAVDRVNGVTPV